MKPREQRNITLSQEAIQIVNDYRVMNKDVNGDMSTFAEAVEKIILQHNTCNR